MGRDGERRRGELAATLVRHFFGGDEALQEYATQSLLTGLDDGDSAEELAVSLESFLAPGRSAPALATALVQLWQAAAGSEWQLEEQADWAQSLKAEPDGESSSPQEPAVASTPALRPAGDGGLRVSAAEFKPGSWAPRPQQQQARQQEAEEEVESVDALLAGLTLPGSADEEAQGWPGSWAQQQLYTGSEAGYMDGSSSSSTGQQRGASSRWSRDSASVASGSGWGLRDEASQAAFLEVLAEQFPFYSMDALQQVFQQQDCSLPGTVDVLCSMEAELEGQRAQAAARRRAAEPAGLSFAEDDFPSLAATGSSAVPGGCGTARGVQMQGPAYAQAARSAAGVSTPASPPAARVRPATAAGGAARAAAKAAPAPIWAAQGVQQFATGAAVAQQYAELRASARDHARLRNQCFEQATQAYLAGQRSLAKELGAMGRWHAEQMRAAHDEAAANTFVQRNAGLLRGRGGSSGGGSGGMPTVDLHGLHVGEALDLLDHTLAEQRRRGTRRLRVVVGVGRHAGGGAGARLPPAVRRHLSERGLAHSEPYEGLLEVGL